MTLEEIFAAKLTENGDKSFNTTMNSLLDLLFMSEYYSTHLDEVKIGNSEIEKIFSMFMRDPRYGMGKRDLGRRLMLMAGATPDEVVKAGRFDDLFIGWEHMNNETFANMCKYLHEEIKKGNELCKKWMPRYSSKNLMLARKIAKTLGMNKQQYGHFIKCNTTENKLSRKNTMEIAFSQVPSLAMIKYYKRFSEGLDTKDRFNNYIEEVKAGKQELKVSTTNVYDIYKNRDVIDPDVFFDKIEKISGSWIPVIDSSGSMQDTNDSYGKALAIGHYLAKCSSYAPDTVLSFSECPQILKLGVANTYETFWRGKSEGSFTQEINDSCKYKREIKSMITGDCSSTNFGALCDKLKDLDAEHAPEWIVVLSDMEFDDSSNETAEDVQKIFKNYGYKTNFIWWSLNSRNKTCPFTEDQFGNVYMSGYSPMLLKFLKAGFNGEQFLNELLTQYRKIMGI